jgi:Fungal specific transcription factor domain/Fungal Zn(2)-Cys(6) binuclear cluster domain
MAESKHAACVCRACNVRKKACDKTLPACSSCTKRNLSCRYEITARARRAHPGRLFVALDVLGSSGPETGQPAQQRYLPAVHSPDSDKSLSQQVLDIISVANLTPKDISERYFQTSHERCPVISPNLFNQRASKYRRAGGSMPVDFSFLLLTMHLVNMLSNPCHPSQLSGFSREQLYIKTKSLFAQAQATICTSLSLIQALLLIATSEYVCLRLEAAYISMTTCAGLARVLGLGKGTLRTSEDVRGNDGVDLVQIERENVVWAIAMTERYEQVKIAVPICV